MKIGIDRGLLVAGYPAQPQYRSHVYRIDPDDGTSDPVQITKYNYNAFGIAWSPDGSRIAVGASPRPDKDPQVRVMGADGRNDRRICRRGVFPTWSPDGAEIAFTLLGGSQGPSLWLVSADGGKPRPLVAPAAFASWSRSGGDIAYVGLEDGESEICLIRPEGTGKRRIARHPRSAYPRWSPDGTMIAYGGPVSGSDGELSVFVMNADGSGVRCLGAGTAPTWSPDGSRLAFLDALDVEQFHSDLGIVDADGSNRQWIDVHGLKLTTGLDWR